MSQLATQATKRFGPAARAHLEGDTHDGGVVGAAGLDRGRPGAAAAAPLSELAPGTDAAGGAAASRIPPAATSSLSGAAQRRAAVAGGQRRHEPETVDGPECQQHNEQPHLDVERPAERGSRQVTLAAQELGGALEPAQHDDREAPARRQREARNDPAQLRARPAGDASEQSGQTADPDADSE